MKNLFLVFSILLFATTVYARPGADSVGVCYLFDGDELKDRDVCVVSRGTGTDGAYTNLFFNKKEYLIEGNYENLEKITYPRGLFYEVVEPERMEYLDDEIIWCFKYEPYDICHI